MWATRRSESSSAGNDWASPLSPYSVPHLDDAPICCSPCQPPGHPAARARSVSRPLASPVPTDRHPLGAELLHP